MGLHVRTYSLIQPRWLAQCALDSSRHINAVRACRYEPDVENAGLFVERMTAWEKSLGAEKPAVLELS